MPEVICPLKARDIIITWRNRLGDDVCVGRIPFLVTKIVDRYTDRKSLLATNPWWISVINHRGKNDGSTLALGDHIIVIRVGEEVAIDL